MSVVVKKKVIVHEIYASNSNPKSDRGKDMP